MLIKIRPKNKQIRIEPNQSQFNVSQQQILPSQEEPPLNNELGFNTSQQVQQIMNPDNSSEYQAIIVQNSKKKQICINLNKTTFNKVKKYIETPEQLKKCVTQYKDDTYIICRICLEQDKIEKFLSPCKCDGSIKHVHQECLQTWLLKKFTIDELRDSKAQCELCKANFICQFIFKNQFVWSRLKEQPISQHLFFLFFLCSGLTLLVLGLFFSIQLGNANEEYYAYVFGACISLITGVLLLYFFATLLFRIVNIETVNQWNIANLETRTETDTESSLQFSRKIKPRSLSLPQIQLPKPTKQQKFGKTIFKFLRRVSVSDI